MQRFFVISLLACLAHSSTYAAKPANAEQLGQTSVANVKTLQEESAKRLAALKQIAGAEKPSAKTSASEKKLDLKKVIQTAKSDFKPRSLEPSFARKVMTLDTNASAFGKVVSALKETLEPQDRRQLLQDFIAAHPRHRDARLHLAREMLLADLPSQALVVLTPLTQVAHRRGHPDWQPWFWQGSAYLALDEPEQARAVLEVALGKDESVAEIWVQLAVVEQALENHAGALQYLQIAEQLAPRLAQVHLGKAYSYERQGYVQQAQAAFRTYLISDTQSVYRTTRPAVVRHLAQMTPPPRRLD